MLKPDKLFAKPSEVEVVVSVFLVGAWKRSGPLKIVRSSDLGEERHDETKLGPKERGLEVDGDGG